MVMPASANLPPPTDINRDLDQYLTTDGARLRFRDGGSGPTVVMVHGWTLDLEMWEPQVAALRDAFRLIRFDRRGFGLSSGRPSVVQDMADIGALCGHLGIGRAALLGMSQGVRAAIGFALSAPDRVSCLILDGPPQFDSAALPGVDEVPIEHYRALVRDCGMSAFRREWSVHRLLSLRTADPRMHEILGAMLLRYPGYDLLETAVTQAVPHASEAIASIDVPVAVITGDGDLESRLQAADQLARQLRGAERASIRNAGHLANLDNPKDYNIIVRSFLERFALPVR